MNPANKTQKKMNISTIVNSVTKSLEGAKIPANVLPATLLKCIAMTRPGLSAYKITAQIIENNKLLGIQTGPNPDGSPNKINQYTYNVVKTIVDAIKNEGSVQTAVPTSSIMVQVTGGNAGGGFVANGFNIMDSLARGIMQ